MKRFNNELLLSFSLFRRCKENPACRYFTIDTRRLMCYLKSEKQSTEKSDMTRALVSGHIL